MTIQETSSACSVYTDRNIELECSENGKHESDMLAPKGTAEKKPTASRSQVLILLLAVFSIAGLIATTLHSGNRRGEDRHKHDTALGLLGSSFEPFGKVDQLHPPFYLIDRPEDAHLQARLETDGFLYLRIEPPSGDAITSFVVFFNLDELRTTGDEPSGSDIYLLVESRENGPSKQLFTGCQPGSENQSDCRTEITIGPGVVSLSADADGAIEVRLSKEDLENSSGISMTENIGLMVNLALYSGSSVSMPASFSNWYTLMTNVSDLPECGDERLTGAVVYSDLVKENFFSAFSYSQLFMSVQNQFVEAGIPYDRLNITDFLTPSVACKYDVLVFPFLSFLSEEHLPVVRNTLHLLIHYYGVSVVACGDFMTNKKLRVPLPGDPYNAMDTLFGIHDASPVFANTTFNEVVITNNATSIFWDREIGEIIIDQGVNLANVSYAVPSTNMYEPLVDTSFNVTSIAEQNIINLEGVPGTFNAILLSELPDAANPYGRRSGRVVHFANLELMGNLDLAWRAVHWTLERQDLMTFGLQLSRQDSVFVCRNDMDQTQFIDQFLPLETDYLNRFLTNWYQKYSFVAAHYVNIGFNTDEGEFTDWNTARSIYQPMLDMESEIGSHSYTHPSDINILTLEELEFEFNQAQIVIMNEMNLSRLGSAQPGQPNTLETAIKLLPYMSNTYFSGGYSQVGAGYPGAFGFIDIDSEMFYISPNTFFDFSAIEFNNFTTDQTEVFWAEQFDNLTKFASTAVIHWPIHDYAPSNWGFDAAGADFEKGPGYTPEMFENFIAKAANANTEFITGIDFEDRWRAFYASSLTVKSSSQSTYDVSIPPAQDHSYARMSFGILNNPSEIISMENYYAYNRKKVYLTPDAGDFTVTIGPAGSAQPHTHISFLPMRAELLSVSGDSIELTFTIRGKGSVLVDLNPTMVAEAGFLLSGGDSAQIQGGVANFTFTSIAEHSATVTLAPTAAPTSASPTSSPTSPQPTDAPTTPTPSSSPSQAPTQGPTTPTPSASPTTLAPTSLAPTDAPTTLSPSVTPTSSPSQSASPTSEPTSTPTLSTLAPTGAPTEDGQQASTLRAALGSLVGMSLLGLAYTSFSGRQRGDSIDPI